jgi:hypothetical protein
MKFLYLGVRDLDVLSSPILMLFFRPFVICSEESGLNNVAGELVTHIILLLLRLVLSQ